LIVIFQLALIQFESQDTYNIIIIIGDGHEHPCVVVLPVKQLMTKPIKLVFLLKENDLFKKNVFIGRAFVVS